MITKPQYFVLVGPPGSGKGTQRARLAKLLDFSEFDMGQVCREQIRLRTHWGLDAKQAIDRGEFVSDPMVLMAFRTNFCPEISQVMDGFPRNAQQFHVFGHMFESYAKSQFIFLDTPLGVCESRIAAGFKRQGRTDDAAMVVARRMKEYEDQTMPLVRLLRASGRLIAVDGDQNQEYVTFSAIAGLKAAGLVPESI